VRTVSISVPIYRKRSSQVVVLSRTPTRVRRRPSAIAKAIALAHHIQAAIDSGRFGSRVDVARRLGLSGARMTQFLTLLTLAPDIQEWLLGLEAVDGVEPIAEKRVRQRLCCDDEWRVQRAKLGPFVAAEEVRPKFCARRHPRPSTAANIRPRGVSPNADHEPAAAWSGSTRVDPVAEA